MFPYPTVWPMEIDASMCQAASGTGAACRGISAVLETGRPQQEVGAIRGRLIPCSQSRHLSHI